MKKRILALVLVFAMVFSMTTTAFAASTISEEASALASLGLLDGNGSGVTAEYLSGEMNRFTAACMILKMNGVYETATKYQYANNFPDAYSMSWDEGKNILGFLKANPQYGFSGLPNGNFSPNTYIDQTSVLKVVLENLGYKQNVDFVWNSVNTFAAQKGIEVVSGKYTIDGLAKNVFSALKTEKKNSTKTLAEELVDKKIIDKNLAALLGLLPMSNLPLAVTAVNFINLRQIQVEFNKPLEEKDAEKVSNYEVDDRTLSTATDSNDKTYDTAQLQDDGKTVILTLNSDIKINNGSVNHKVKVGTGTGIATAVEFDKLKALDATFPTVVDIRISGPKTVDIKFSEPVEKSSSYNPFTLTMDGKKIGLSTKVDFSENNQIVTINTLSELKDGDYILGIEASTTKFIKDFAGYMVAAQDIPFDATKDTGAPTAEIVKSVSTKTGTKVTFRFNKAMKLNGNKIANLKAKLGYNVSSETGVDLIKVADKTNEYTAEFNQTNKPLAPGVHTIYLVGGTTSATRAKDTWGVVFEDAVLTFDVELDTTKPTVQGIEIKEENTLIVTFSEDVVAAKFAIKDEAGKKVNLKSTPTSTVDNKLTLILSENFKGGIYNVEVKDAKDLSIFENKMDAVTVSVDTTDKVAPVVKSASQINSTQVRVVFDSVMDEAITEKTNWGVLRVGNAATITIKKVELSDDGKSVVITFNGNFDPKDGDADQNYNTLQLINAKDLAGNTVVGSNGLVKDIVVAAQSSTIVPTKVKLTGADEVTVIYEDQILDNVGDGVYRVTLGEKTYSGKQIETSVDIDGGTDTVVRLKLNVPTNTNGRFINPITEILDIKVEMVATGENIPENQYNARLDASTIEYGKITTSNGTITTKNIVTDWAAPIMVGATAEVGNTIIVKFTENLYTASVQDDDFAISGYEISRVRVTTDKTVEITLKDDPMVKGETISVQLVGVVADRQDNQTTETAEFDITVTRENTADVTFGTGTVDQNTKTVAVNTDATTVDITVGKNAAQSLNTNTTGVSISNGNVIKVTGLNPGEVKTFNLTVSERNKGDITYVITVTASKAAITGVNIVNTTTVDVTLSAAIAGLSVADFVVTAPAGTTVTNAVAKTGNTAYTLTLSPELTAGAMVTVAGSGVKINTNPATSGPITAADGVTFTGTGVTQTEKVVTVAAPANTKTFVLTAPLVAGQTVTFAGADVVLDTTTAPLAPTFTVSNLTAGATKTFTVTVAQTGKTAITYTITVNVAKAEILSAVVTGTNTIDVTLNTAKTGLGIADFTATTGATIDTAITGNGLTKVTSKQDGLVYTLTLTNPLAANEFVKVTATTTNLNASSAIAQNAATATVGIALTTPIADANNTITITDKAVAINLANGNNAAAITVTKTAAQTITIGGTDAAKVTVNNTIPTAPVFSLVGLTPGAKTFTLTVSEAGKAAITYNITITVA